MENWFFSEGIYAPEPYLLTGDTPSQRLELKRNGLRRPSLIPYE
jgi:hypothetical protein